VNFDTYATFGVDLASSEPDELDATDPLASLDGLRDLLRGHEWLSARARAADLDALRTLRRELRGVFDAAGAGRSAAAVEGLNRLLDRHPPIPRISGHDDSDWHLHVGSDQVPMADELAAMAVMGLTMVFLDHGSGRFGACSDPRCSGVFIDTSRNRSRRYCSDRCATRANVAAHRRRHRAAG
jgi:predicted RNA-binding Zn ribbon-like protein